MQYPPLNCPAFMAFSMVNTDEKYSFEPSPDFLPTAPHIDSPIHQQTKPNTNPTLIRLIYTNRIILDSPLPHLPGISNVPVWPSDFHCSLLHPVYFWRNSLFPSYLHLTCGSLFFLSRPSPSLVSRVPWSWQPCLCYICLGSLITREHQAWTLSLTK